MRIRVVAERAIGEGDLIHVTGWRRPGTVTEYLAEPLRFGTGQELPLGPVARDYVEGELIYDGELADVLDTLAARGVRP